MERKAKTYVTEVTYGLVGAIILTIFVISFNHFFMDSKVGTSENRAEQWDVLHESNQRPRLMISGDILRSHGIPVDEKSMQSAYSMFEEEHIYLFAIWNTTPSLYKVIVAYSQEKEMPLTVSNIDEAVNGGLLWERLRAATEKADGDGDDK